MVLRDIASYFSELQIREDILGKEKEGQHLCMRWCQDLVTLPKTNAHP
jgi:hypothetical protein